MCYVLIANDFGLFLNYNRKAKVSHELFTTVEPMKEVAMISYSFDANSKCFFLQWVFLSRQQVPIIGKSCFIQARLCTTKKAGKSDQSIKVLGEVSDQIKNVNLLDA